MLVSDLLHSCANEGVAEAAVASIGGSFAAEIEAEAVHAGVGVGALTASHVRSFARRAGERDWRDLVDALRGQDFPLLHGLQVILERRVPEPRSGARLPRSTKPLAAYDASDSYASV
ncbi:hypothetical protein LGH83_03625 [Lichenihabitans sp. PAMC28606]|uniref:hypothetical protein n=1 Tax=Lichenihabitans sp. PAMC28606 TaxID=2880932 RepID=UPI001D0B1773|nr:hypothetical protein [Lichenihabitans sp. PAMC28606]UDL95328.1 hypothetical protein LGH83_03625 [Lichenihabitans sp. PAMC28606]